VLEDDKKISEKQPSRQFTPLTLAGLSLELGLMIALPAVLLGLFGKFLDERWGTVPLFAVSGILLAIIASTVWIARHFSKVLRSSSNKQENQPSDKKPL